MKQNVFFQLNLVTLFTHRLHHQLLRPLLATFHTHSLVCPQHCNVNYSYLWQLWACGCLELLVFSLLVKQQYLSFYVPATVYECIKKHRQSYSVYIYQ